MPDNAPVIALEEHYRDAEMATHFPVGQGIIGINAGYRLAPEARYPEARGTSRPLYVGHARMHSD
jgi:hypothetical protein